MRGLSYCLPSFRNQICTSTSQTKLKLGFFISIAGYLIFLVSQPHLQHSTANISYLNRIRRSPEFFLQTVSTKSDCRILTTYDGILRQSATNGYRFLTSGKCIHTNMNIKPNLKPYFHSDCSLPVLVMKGMGRMGNQICEYLSGKLLQMYFKVPVALEPELHRNISKHFINLDLPMHDKHCRNDTKEAAIEYLDHILFMNYKSPHYHPIRNLRNQSFIVDNYPCLMDLLMKNRKEISQSMAFQPSILEQAKANLQKALESKNFSREKTLISVHVRRTDYDYRLNLVFNRTYLSPCYYQQAMHHYRLMFNETVFVVASDDIEWCKRNIKDLDVVFLDTPEDVNPIIDMAAMSLCDHHIVGLGTFGFLAAYLSGTGLITHSFVLRKMLTEFENDLLCSNSPDLIPIPDLGSGDLKGLRSP